MEEMLHQARWDAHDADVDTILNNLKSPVAYHGFLKHAETQGDILEGLVLLGLNIDVGTFDDLEQLCREVCMLSELLISNECICIVQCNNVALPRQGCTWNEGVGQATLICTSR